MKRATGNSIGWHAERMSPEQSRLLRLGQRLTWQGDRNDEGIVAELDWTGVRIHWCDGKTSFHHHNDMRNIEVAPVKI